MKAHARRLGHGCGPWRGRWADAAGWGSTGGGGGGRGVDGAGRAELERLGRSAARREADRARAMLWSLEGETSGVIATRLGIRAEQVRRWRSAVRSGGLAVLRARPRPG